MYLPKYIKCKLKKVSPKDELFKRQLICKDDAKEIECMEKFYDELEGIELILSLWDHDNYSCYHLSRWANEVDEKVMMAMWYLEQISPFGCYGDFEEFKKDWIAGEYDPGASIVFDKEIVEEIEVLREEVKEG